MLDEIKISTREVIEDYIWFSSDRVDEEWRNKYKGAFFNPSKDVNFFVEITNNEYRFFFDKINSDRKDKEGRTIYSVLMACGQRGSESSNAVFKLFKHYFLRGGEIVRQLFNREFTEKFIETVYDKAQTVEVENKMHEKLAIIISELEDVEFKREDIAKDNSYFFTDLKTGKNGFLTLLELITKTETVNGIVSLVMTSKPITEERLQGFDHTIFSRGLCLTTGTVEGGRIEKTIKELPPENEPEPQPEPQPTSVDPKSTDDTSDDNSPQKEGTTSTQNADGKQKETDLIEKIKNLVSSSPLSKLLPILSIILILTLIIVVRSCSKNDSSVQQKNDTVKIATPKPSNDSLMKSTKDTLNK